VWYPLCPHCETHTPAEPDATVIFCLHCDQRIEINNPFSCLVKEAAMAQAKFVLGQLVATPGALHALEEAGQSPMEFLARHQMGDWGDLGDEDKKENEFSVSRQLRILSAYNLTTGVKIWVITEADRSVTTILLPEEY
jgi:hypothetical protein